MERNLMAIILFHAKIDYIILQYLRRLFLNKREDQDRTMHGKIRFKIYPSAGKMMVICTLSAIGSRNISIIHYIIYQRTAINNAINY